MSLGQERSDAAFSIVSKEFLNQARAGRRPARAWFIEITSVRMYVCVCVCVCVWMCVCPPPRP